MNDLVREAYLTIFSLMPELCVIDEVKPQGRVWGDAGGECYKFIAKIVSPTHLFDVAAGSMIAVKKELALECRSMTGIDIVKTVSLKDGKKTIKFDFSSHLIPDNVLDFQIRNGLYEILAICHGSFHE